VSGLVFHVGLTSDAIKKKVASGGKGDEVTSLLLHYRNRLTPQVKVDSIIVGCKIPRVVHGTYLSVPSQSNLCLSHSIGFPLHYDNINVEYNSVKILNL